MAAVPECPDGRHRGSVVTRAGWYGAPGRARQRWWCRPRQGAAHRFTEPLPRLVATGGLVHECPTCQTVLEPWEGRPAPRLYGFAVGDVAWALAQVAGGASYRSVADRVRTRAGRELSKDATVSLKSAGKGKQVKVRNAPPNAHGQLVSDWVEVFAPVLWATYAPARWPSDVVLDADPVTFTRRSGGVGHSFATLAVVGYDEAHRPYVAGVKAVPKATVAAWKKFLTSIPGAPTWVVTDGGTPEVKGAGAAWRWAEQWRCEWHLRANLSSSYPAWLREDRSHKLWAALATAQTSPAAWRAYRRALKDAAAEHGDLTGALTQAARLDELVKRQAAARPALGDGHPTSIGPVEDFFRRLTLALDGRSATMSNEKRADALLTLLAMGRNGWVDETRWTQLLTDHLLSQKAVPKRGRPTRRQRTVAETRANPSLPKAS